ncbi:MAG TPA: pentapeptide repeat-containing protein [Candidatus Acidoferrum sp.]|nr:pentapeptide repeat-containing protein [Candidatus Acidoferrum sp.]
MSGARADLTDADLTCADLAGADLTCADLTRANLADANLTRANLSGADLTDANLADADLTRAKNVPMMPAEASAPGRQPQTHEEWRANRPKNAAERAQRYRERHPEVPVVENLDAKILSVIEGGDGRLEMGSWHTCETTHCRAGWAIHLAGKPGYELEQKYGDPAIAGRMIYRASTGRGPHFYATNASALEDIKRCAAEQKEAP